MGDGLRIDDLSRLSAVSVRNIREYQDRGLLPPPRREGRVVLYDDDHLVRLKLIARLLARGYTLAVIRDLLDAWASGRDLEDVLGLEEVVSLPWGDDEPADLSREGLSAMFRGWLTDGDVLRLVSAGVLVPRGDGFHCPRRRLLDVFPTLVDAGIPPAQATAVIARTRPHLDRIADDMVALVLGSLFPEGTADGLPDSPDGTGLVRAAEAVEHLRPVADVVTAGLFALAISDAVDRGFDQVARRALGSGAAPSGDVAG